MNKDKHRKEQEAFAAYLNKTRMTFIGSGSAFINAKDNWQSNVVISNGGKNLLIDCGSDARHALAELPIPSLECKRIGGCLLDVGSKKCCCQTGTCDGQIPTYYSAKNIDAVFITHLHADHIGGLEWLAFSTYFDPSIKKPILFLKNGELARQLWQSLKGGLALQFKKAALKTFFDVYYTGEKFTWQNIPFDVIQTIHTMDNNTYNLSYGLKFPLNNKEVFFSGDTQFAPHQYMEILQSVDLILHDCETSPFESGVHSHYKKMLDLPNDIKNKMYLYHYDKKVFDAKKEGFLGWVDKGQTFE